MINNINDIGTEQKMTQKDECPVQYEAHTHQKLSVRNTYKGNRVYVKGFTIIELLIAISLFAIITTSLYFSMRSGLLLHKRSQEGLQTSRDIALFLDQLNHELNNAIPYTPKAFQGKATELSFPTMLTYYDKKKAFHNLFYVTYAYDSRKVLRQTTLLKDEKKQLSKSILLNKIIQKLSFQYGFYDRDEETIEWKDAWEPEENGVLPRAIKVSMTVRYIDADVKKMADKRYIRKILIPHGSWPEEIS